MIKYKWIKIQTKNQKCKIICKVIIIKVIKTIIKVKYKENKNMNYKNILFKKEL